MYKTREQREQEKIFVKENIRFLYVNGEKCAVTIGVENEYYHDALKLVGKEEKEQVERN